MEENNGSGSSKHQNEVLEVSNSSKQDNSDVEGTSTIDDQNEHLHAIIADEIPLNRAKMVGHAPLTSSSASSCSSNLLDVDYDEKDAVDVSSSSEENGSREDAESSADTSSSSPQWSMVSESPLHGPTIESSSSPEISPQSSSLNAVNTSPMQSPVVQVMGRTGSYDPNRIPWSTFTPKPANDTDWAANSSDSLFSLYNGKSGELNKADFSSGLPTVIETTLEIDQKSVSTIGEAGEKENLEIQSEAPNVSINEDGKGVDPASAVIEDASSLKSDSKTTPPPSTPPATEGAMGTTPKTGGRRCCFNCFSCCSSRG
ncbi:uncharacterized protein LOC112513281 [Cynara cardunculus var. scolymus]|uniref:uncharacterized protein LOC112513281 n=1 Tax=Cynara cardunculus var. scolymus TaxID=59895 RepID=UPI000D62606A|nr:uncharacterized protein LOC112513281 [Cynara cardunculus var. scolymus]